MKNRNSEIISYLRQYSIKDNSDIIIDLFEEESYNYKIIYKVSASVNGITEIYINGNKVYYDKIPTTVLSICNYQHLIIMCIEIC